MRDYFHVPENYFLSHSVGCLPKLSPEALQARFFGPWMSGETWSEWMGGLEAFRAGIGALLRVESSLICPQVNISSALTKILFSLPKRDGRDVILLSKMDFPTIGFVAKQAERLGYHLKFVDGNPADLGVWERAIDESVAVVLATHALSNTSQILPIEAICEKAKTKGAISIVDVAQSLGAVPVDLPKWDPDFVIGTGVKFLCFGPGACFLYAADRWLPQCRPLDVGWFSHENPFEMDIERFRFAPDAMRFFGGTPSPAPIILANAALSGWAKIGLETAQSRIQKHLSHLHRYLDETAVVSPRDPAARGATLVLATAYGNQITDALEATQIKFDQRQQGYRFSVHGYTSDAEIETLAGMFSQLK